MFCTACSIHRPIKQQFPKHYIKFQLLCFIQSHHTLKSYKIPKIWLIEQAKSKKPHTISETEQIGSQTQDFNMAFYWFLLWEVLLEYKIKQA